MKFFSKASLSLGILGFVINLHYLYEYWQFLEEFGELEANFDYQIISQLEFLILGISQVLGLILGLIGLFKEEEKKFSQIAFVLCLLNIILHFII